MTAVAMPKRMRSDNFVSCCLASLRTISDILYEPGLPIDGSGVSQPHFPAITLPDSAPGVAPIALSDLEPGTTTADIENSTVNPSNLIIAPPVWHSCSCYLANADNLDRLTAFKLQISTL